MTITRRTALRSVSSRMSSRQEKQSDAHESSKGRSHVVIMERSEADEIVFTHKSYKENDVCMMMWLVKSSPSNTTLPSRYTDFNKYTFTEYYAKKAFMRQQGRKMPRYLRPQQQHGFRHWKWKLNHLPEPVVRLPEAVPSLIPVNCKQLLCSHLLQWGYS